MSVHAVTWSVTDLCTICIPDVLCLFSSSLNIWLKSSDLIFVNGMSSKATLSSLAGQVFLTRLGRKHQVL